MWYALAEFVDNSTQSRTNYESIIDEVLKAEGVPLKVEINYDRVNRVISIDDNSIGMSCDDLIAALKIAEPTQDSRGRSKYGMGMKTAACWIGNKWSVTTCEWGSGEEWTAEVNVGEVVKGNATVPLTKREVDTNDHYTRIKIWDMNRGIQKRTEETIMTYLGSMYRMDIREKRLVLLFNGNPAPLPEEFDIARREDGAEWRESFQTTVGGKSVTGWFAVLKTGGRKLGGFSLFQNDRQIRGYPDAWKPRTVYGGIEDEGSNTLVAQRLVGEIVLDGFDVSHTKDAILFRGSEEEELEMFLAEQTQKLKAFATSMRKGERKSPWSKEKITELMEGIKKEFESGEFRDVVQDAIIPPLSVIQESNRKQVAALDEEDILFSLDVGAGIKVRVYFQNRSENDPHLTLLSESDGLLNVVINQQHPYYLEIESDDRADELMRQYVYDAIAEYRAFQRISRQEPDVIRKLKNDLLRSKITRLENEDSQRREREVEKLKQSE